MKSSLFDSAVSLAPQVTQHEARADGSFVLKSGEPLAAYARCIGEWVERWAVETPEALAFAERAPDGEWRRMTWREVRAAVGSIGQALLSLQLPAERPVAVLSDNSIDHALFMLGAMHVGRAVCSVSSAYCRMATDYVKIRAILQALSPVAIYASDAVVYGPAIKVADVDAISVFGKGGAASEGSLSFDTLLQAVEGPAVMEAFHAIRPDDHAKYLLTSGSTGQPKVVINTHRMLCANQQMMGQVWRFLDHEKPVLVDWLPWSHTFGGNHDLNLILRNGGSLYIDEGRPAPHLIGKTIRNLRDVRPTMLFNVPSGFDMMLPALEQDDELAADVFSRLRMVFYAGAALAPSTWNRLEAVAQRVREAPIWFTTSWGSTETSPTVTSAHWRLDGAGCIGLPLPGVELKFVPSGEKLELRVRGVSVFPGYRDAPQLTADAFDSEGFYRIGDAGYLVDPSRPEQGVMFHGRVAEDFKLATGTWVSVGTLRLKLISAMSPWAQDIVVAGHDQAEVGLLIFPSAQARLLAPDELASSIRKVLVDLRSEGTGSSQCPTRALVQLEPPRPDLGEITDKGYINQRAVLTHRAAEVEVLFCRPSHPRVIHFEKASS